MTLPIKTTLEDVQKIVSYLKSKPTGASMAEARAAVGSAMDGRKLKAYAAWGIADASTDRVVLTEEGRQLAREPERAVEIYRRAIDKVRPYRAALEWANVQRFDQLSLDDTAAHWHQHQADDLGTDNEETIKAAVACFFNLADGAKLGNYIKGRGGKPTRLEIDQAQLAAYIEAGPSTPPVSPSDEADLGGADLDFTDTDVAAPVTLDAGADATPPVGPAIPRTEDELRVFIAHGKNMRVVEQVQTMLDLASVPSEFAEDEETTAIPVPDKVLGAMRRCTAGIICVSADETKRDENGDYSINENVLIEIGAAFVLYDRKVILLWDDRLKVPSNLQGLYRCQYHGEEIGWDAGMKLMKAVSDFKPTKL